MVIPEKSGWLVEDIETEPMIEKLNTIISDESYRNLRKSTGEIGLRLLILKRSVIPIWNVLNRRLVEMFEIEQKLGVANKIG